MVTTTAAKSAVETPAGPQSYPFASGALSLEALVGLFTGRRTRRRFLSILSLMLLLIGGTVGAGLTGCSSGSSVSTASKGNYLIIVTATPAVASIKAALTPGPSKGKAKTPAKSPAQAAAKAPAKSTKKPVAKAAAKPAAKPAPKKAPVKAAAKKPAAKPAKKGK